MISEPRSSCPINRTLEMVGDQWSLVAEQMRAAAALLPNCATQVVDGAAYLVPLEAPTEFANHVREL